MPRDFDAEYEHHLETYVKTNFPYEYALLKSDLKENLKKLQGSYKNGEDPHHISDNIATKVRWMR